MHRRSKGDHKRPGALWRLRPAPTVVHPFRDPEEAWLWFWLGQLAREAGGRRAPEGLGLARPCEGDDIYRLVLAQYRAGRLTKAEVAVLVRYGRRQIPPDRRLPEEERHAALWAAALDRLVAPMRARGMIEGPSAPLRGESGPCTARD